MSAEEVGARIERLTAEIAQLDDPRARRLAEELSLTVLEMHGEGLAALIAGLDPTLVRRAADDEMVGGLLMLHGLHPVPIDERVRTALARHDVEVLEVVDGVARLKRCGSGGGCGAANLEQTVQRALQTEVPDLAGAEFEHDAPVVGIALPLAGGQAVS